MRVADYIVNFLVNNGIKHSFLLSGGGAIYLDDALACNPEMTYTGVRNEATAPMMASGYARITNNMGAVFVTTGPGGTNAVTGVAEAWVDSTPIIVISGQVEKKYTTRMQTERRLRSFGIQELDIIEIVKPITKYAVMVENAEDIRYHLQKALYMAKSGRPGPVWLDIPTDVQAAEINEKELKKFEKPIEEKKEVEEFDLKEIITQIQNAEKPLLIIGQGIKNSNAQHELIKYLNKFAMPVISSRLGQDILGYDFPLYCGHGGTQGNPATKYIMKNADVVVSIGCSLSPGFICKGKAFDKNAKIYAVDIDEAELNKKNDISIIPIKCDAKEFLIKITEAINAREKSEWIERCCLETRKGAFVYNAKRTSPLNLYYFLQQIDELAKDDSIFVNDAGSSYYSGGQALTFSGNKREVTSGTFASMGLSVPLAIGASCAERQTDILAVTGDGSIETNIQELKTLSDENANVKLFVINNGGYLSIRSTQEKKFDGRYINSTQNNDGSILNFADVGKAFGLPYYSIKDSSEIEPVFKKVTSFKGPALIEVFVDNKKGIYNCY